MCSFFDGKFPLKTLILRRIVMGFLGIWTSLFLGFFWRGFWFFGGYNWENHIFFLEWELRFCGLFLLIYGVTGIFFLSLKILTYTLLLREILFCDARGFFSFLGVFLFRKHQNGLRILEKCVFRYMFGMFLWQ